MVNIQAQVKRIFMKDIEKITQIKVPQFPDIKYDYMQEKILNNVFLELELENMIYLVEPNNLQLIKSPQQANDFEEEVHIFLSSNKDLIYRLKKYLLYNLISYSGLLETNSYFIANNNFLTIARFIPTNDSGSIFKIKLYTINEYDIRDNYDDKIYLGRIFISMEKSNLAYFGFLSIQNSLIKQFNSIEQLIIEEDLINSNHKYITDLGLSFKEMMERTDNIVANFQPFIDKETPINDIININVSFREIKHILAEMLATVTDWEAELNQVNIRVAKQVTKLRKDLHDDINFILLKINGRLTDSINNIQLLNF